MSDRAGARPLSEQILASNRVAAESKSSSGGGPLVIIWRADGGVPPSYETTSVL